MHKSAIWDRTPPPTHQIQSTCVQEGSRVPNLQTEFNYLDLFKSYGNFSDFIVPTWSLWSPHCPHHLSVILIIPTSFPLSPHCPHSPQKVPIWSPWLWSPWSPWSLPDVVPIIPTSSRRFPHHPQPPIPPGGSGPQISKNAIRFELIEIL